mgnify:CR=1 FL=1
MAYNETTVVIGGLTHIPVIILILRFVENRFNKNNTELQWNQLQILN